MTCPNHKTSKWLNRDLAQGFGFHIQFSFCYIAVIYVFSNTKINALKNALVLLSLLCSKPGIA